ncbi:hypothetical protein PHG201 (plasmid) [Cupriavidus necator H16]|uniref:Uncharacterized protein n=1 Tax=Cupriavidus necator (strain ATCC 17699 / DSM 428 / KCTC 22496 / NCIMB 10442 / H16 / Stanier 337) TaxID=381666 RepID=Q7WXD3_CUPNH|nr:hypothetical protein PHG201 [Cupriavidus necator H16]
MQWLAGDAAPSGFTVDQEIELQSGAESKATVRYVRHPLDAENLRRHIAAGKRCTRLAMTWNVISGHRRAGHACAPRPAMRPAPPRPSATRHAPRPRPRAKRSRRSRRNWPRRGRRTTGQCGTERGVFSRRIAPSGLRRRLSQLQ